MRLNIFSCDYSFMVLLSLWYWYFSSQNACLCLLSITYLKYALSAFLFCIFKFLNNTLIEKLQVQWRGNGFLLKIWFDAPSPMNKRVYVFYKQGRCPINQNKTIKIRKLTLMHYYHLILRSRSIFTGRPSNVLYSKRIQFSITPCFLLVMSF